MGTSGPSPIKVLFVEDELPADRKESWEIQLLESEGDIAVRGATDGTEALKLFKSWNPDIIVLDIMLPPGPTFAGEAVRDGLETGLVFWKHINEVLGNTSPVIVLTNHPTAHMRAKELGLQETEWIPKPLKISTLARLIRTHTGSRQGESRPRPRTRSRRVT